MKGLSPLGLLLAANLFWSTGGWLIKEVDLSGPALAGWRSLIAALFLLALRRFKLDLRASRWTWLGAVSFAVNTVCFVSATRLGTAANAILLQYTAPIYVIALSAIFLGERLRGRDLWAAAGSMLGLLLLFFDRLEGSALLANLLALGAGLSFAGTILLLRREAQSDPLRIVILGNLLAAVLLSPIWMSSPVESADWLPLLALGVIQFGLGYACYANGVKGVSAVTAVLFAAIEPVLNPLWVALILGEVPGPLGMTGGLLVLLAVTGRALLAAQAARTRSL